jgi:4-amino-4-deoxy-L-arabinose transferase-like glycosyltransferase
MGFYEERIWSDILFKHDLTELVEQDSATVSRPAFDQLSPLIHLSLLLLLAALIYVGSAWKPSLQDDADSAHAEAAREMVERGDWVTLHINGVRYLEKAPLIYWAVATSYKIFGFTEFATRLPLALGAMLLVVAVYYFGRWMGGGKAGFYSGLAMCASLGVYLFTRIMIPEVVITFFMTVAFYFFLKVYLGELEARWAYVFYACMAAAVLTKGLIGIVFPCGALFVFVLMTKGWRQLSKMRPITGSLLFLAIAVPWHALAIWRNEKFFWFYFVNEHFLRYLGKRYPADYDTVPIASFWLLHLVWLFPFSVFLPLALGRVRDLWRPTEREGQLRLFACLWALVVIGFFSFSTRQEYYTFPAFPALALLAGVGLARGEKENSRWVMAGQGLLAFVGVVVGLALGCLLWLSRKASAAADISQTLTQNPENYKLALGHMSDLTVEAFAVLRVPAAGAALTLSVGFALAFILRRKQRTTQAGLLTAATVACFIYFAHMALGVFNPYLSSQPLAEAIKRRLATGDLVVINGEYQGGSSIGFYLPQKVLLLNGRMTGLEFGSHYPDAPPVFIGDGEIAQMWQGDHRVFLFTRDEEFEKVRSVVKGEMFRLASAGEKSIYSNRP